jgi:hypothetical protein
MERMYSREEVEKMCSESYMRGMMVQYESTQSNKNRKPIKVFVEWLKELIDTCSVKKLK